MSAFPLTYRPNPQSPEKVVPLVQYNDSLDVVAMFQTIQGEGPFSGRPAIFIRLAGCNLQCPACDTEYTDGRAFYSVPRIIADLHDTCELPIHMEKRPIVVITGGEPFRQNISPLVQELVDLGFTVQVETNGTLPPTPFFPKEATIVCSPKTGKVHAKMVERLDAYKYVIDHTCINPSDGLSRQALDHPVSIQIARPLRDNIPIYVQPMDTKNEIENDLNTKCAADSAMRFGYILQVQLHKIVGVA